MNANAQFVHQNFLHSIDDLGGIVGNLVETGAIGESVEAFSTGESSAVLSGLASRSLVALSGRLNAAISRHHQPSK